MRRSENVDRELTQAILLDEDSMCRGAPWRRQLLGITAISLWSSGRAAAGRGPGRRRISLYQASAGKLSDICTSFTKRGLGACKRIPGEQDTSRVGDHWPAAVNRPNEKEI